MTPLEAHLKERIINTGPLRVSEFMELCLLHPDYGYYTTQPSIGHDFITAPEVSQMFGEMLGLALAQTWLDQGAPPEACLVELGPGRGTLMRDIWRATAHVPGFHRAMRVYLCEVSPRLKALQAQAVPHAKWISDLSELPSKPMFLIANEFFDALPIRQMQNAGDVWQERLIGLDGEAFCFGLGGPMSCEAIAHRLSDTVEGDVVEYCPQAQPIMASLGGHIQTYGGAAYVIDYGDWRALGDTLQAVKAHQKVDLLERVGDVDLTAHVDFEALALGATPARYSRLTPQGVFLERLGITQRAQVLAKGLSGAALDSHVLAHKRLTHPDEMGQLFKVLGIYPDGRDAPVGVNA